MKKLLLITAIAALSISGCKKDGKKAAEETFCWRCTLTTFATDTTTEISTDIDRCKLTELQVAKDIEATNRQLDGRGELTCNKKP